MVDFVLSVYLRCCVSCMPLNKMMHVLSTSMKSNVRKRIHWTPNSISLLATIMMKRHGEARFQQQLTLITPESCTTSQSNPIWTNLWRSVAPRVFTGMFRLRKPSIFVDIGEVRIQVRTNHLLIQKRLHRIYNLHLLLLIYSFIYMLTVMNKWEPLWAHLKAQ